ncbi:hypothetical protein C8R45DRAFT_985550 [Mycena sanguinolenta]|nr:hypothetical protein C8R45DRAFT_985550 [Mycena sanguinolenta]
MRVFASQFTAILAAITIALPVAAMTPRSPDEGTVFAVYPGWDQNDGEGTLIQGGTEGACLAACSASSTCIAYSYVPYSTPPACFLKPVVNLASFSVDSGRVVSTGLVGPCGTFEPIGPTICVTIPA